MEIDRYLVFFTGIYGKQVDSFINEFFKLLMNAYPTMADIYAVPDQNTAYQLTWTFDSPESMADFLLALNRDDNVHTVISFDHDERGLFISKGFGTIDDIIDTYIVALRLQYYEQFNEILAYTYIGDARSNEPCMN